METAHYGVRSAAADATLRIILCREKHINMNWNRFHKPSFAATLPLAIALLLAGCNARKSEQPQPAATPNQTTSATLRKPAVKNGLPKVDYADLPKLKLDKLPTDKSGRRIVAMVNDQPITENRFRAELRTAMSKQSPKSEQETQAFQSGLAAPVLDNLLSTALVTEYAAKQKLTVSGDEIDRFIAAANNRLRDGNKLSDDAIRKGLTREEMRQDILERLLMKKVEEHLGKSLPPATGEELANFALSHPEITSGAEEIRVSHIVIRAHDNESTAQIDSARQKARAVLDEIRAGLDFAEAARRHSQDAMTAPRGGDLGYCTRGKMYPAFDDAAFAIKAGETTGVVQTPVGFHIIHVADRRQGNAQSLYMIVQRKKAFVKWLQEARAQARIEKFL